MDQYSWDDLYKKGEDAGGSIELLPVGPYTVVVTKADAGRTKAGDKDQIVVKGKVVGGPYDGNLAPINYLTITTDNDVALAMFFRNLAGYGLDKQYFASKKPTVSQIAADLIGKTATYVVAHNEYNGETRAKVGSVKAAVGAGAGASSPPGAAPTVPAPQAGVAAPPAPPAAPAPPAPPVAPAAPPAPPPPPAPPAPPAAPAAPVPEEPSASTPAPPAPPF